MSDLISRSALLDEIESLSVHITGLRSGKDVLADCMKEYKKSVLRIIDEQPTAYDAEKVVAELEEAQEKLETDMWAKESNNWYGEYCNGMSEGYEKAIDIVRKGGVE